jgi:uncharacterized protein
MVSRQDALLNLSSLLAHGPGSDSEVEGEGRFVPSQEQLDEDGLRLAGPLAWRITVRNTGGDDDLIAEGEVSGAAILECRRCLREVEAPVTASFFYPMTYLPGKRTALHLIEAPLAGDVNDLDPTGDVGEDRLAFGRPEVDFGPLLRQVFAIDLPLTVLCKESCRGLSIDGVDLNEHPDHVPAESGVATDHGEEASPFAVLKDLDIESRS